MSEQEVPTWSEQEARAYIDRHVQRRTPGATGVIVERTKTGLGWCARWRFGDTVWELTL